MEMKFRSAEKIGDMPHGMQNPRYHKCRDLERRLAACREALEGIYNDCMSLEDADEIAKNALELTAPK